jgi:hypothetical protein
MHDAKSGCVYAGALFNRSGEPLTPPRAIDRAIPGFEQAKADFRAGGAECYSEEFLLGVEYPAESGVAGRFQHIAAIDPGVTTNPARCALGGDTRQRQIAGGWAHFAGWARSGRSAVARRK